MRIGLLDPRWVEQRDKHLHEKINQETVYAPGMLFLLIYGSGLRRLAGDLGPNPNWAEHIQFGI